MKVTPRHFRTTGIDRDRRGSTWHQRGTVLDLPTTGHIGPRGSGNDSFPVLTHGTVEVPQDELQGLRLQEAHVGQSHPSAE